MSYTVESINGCTKKLVFSFESLDLTEDIKASVQKKRKEVNLKGYRKGKAPLAMVEKLYGPQIESDALNSFLQKEFFDAVTKEELKVVGYPSFENVKYESGKSVGFDAVVEIYPDFELKEMKDLTFTQDKAEITDAEVEDVKKNYLSSKAEEIAITDESVALDKGMLAVMNFQGVKEDGEKPENMKGSDYVLEIGSGQFIPGFEDGMLGMKKGENKNIDLTFPEDYHEASLKSAKVTFEVELLEIKERKLPELTDELAKEFKYESAEDFETKNRERLLDQKKRQVKEKLHQEILEKLVEDNQFDVPVIMVEQQKNYIREDIAKNLKYQGFNEDMLKDYFEKWQDDLVKKANFQVRSGLILDKLANKYEIESSDSDLEAKIEETAKSSGVDAEQVRQYYTSDEKIRKNLMYAIREEKTFEKLIELINVQEA